MMFVHEFVRTERADIICTFGAAKPAEWLKTGEIERNNKQSHSRAEFLALSKWRANPLASSRQIHQ
jgi:hypothetical protein